MRYPTEVEAIELLDKYRLPKAIKEHSKDVAKIALKIAGQIKENGHDIDLDLVKSAALLHDIGKWKYLKIDRKNKHIMHAQESGRILRELGWPEFAALCESHFGVGVREAKIFGLPEPRDMMPKTLEAKVLYLADKIRPDSPNLKQMVELYKTSRKLEKRYWSLCPGFREKTIKDVTKIWHELEKLGMKV